MKDGTILLIEGDRKRLVDRAIMDITGSPYSHTAIVIAGFTFESTIWLLPNSKPWMLWRYRSGVKLTVGTIPHNLALFLKAERSPMQVQAGLRKAVELVNSRGRYNFALTLFDALLYPTRKLWSWIYRRTGWAPFMSGLTNCSYLADLLEKAMGIDLWPDEPESLTVPGDYPICAALERIS